MTNLIEFAKQAGIVLVPNTKYGDLELLATLIGNAKLEEAAQACEADYEQAHSYDADGLSMGHHSDALTCAAAIRNLKEPTQ